MNYFKTLMAVLVMADFSCNARAAETDRFQNILCSPDSISVATDQGSFELQKTGDSQWRAGTVAVTTKFKHDGLHIQLRAPDAAVRKLCLRWKADLAPDWKYLGDAWERAYGDLEWKPMDASRVMPWYFLASNGKWTHGYGV